MLDSKIELTVRNNSEKVYVATIEKPIHNLFHQFLKKMTNSFALLFAVPKTHLVIYDLISDYVHLFMNTWFPPLFGLTKTSRGFISGEGIGLMMNGFQCLPSCQRRGPDP